MPKRIVTPPANRKEHAASGSSPPVVSVTCEEGSPRPSFPSLRRTRFSSVPLIKLKNNADTKDISIPTSVELPRRHVNLCSDTDSDSSLPRTGGFCTDSMDSNFRELSSSPPSVRIKHLTRNNEDGASRFPKLDECAHFHYDNVELGPIEVALCEGGDDRIADGKNSISNPSSGSEIDVRVTSNGKSWQIRRSLDHFQMLDRQLHRCVYDRKFSQLKDISQPPEQEDALQIMLTQYLERFSQLAGSLINCGTVLNWLELDNRGNRLIVTDEAAINTPAVAAAYVVKRYSSQASDEISLEVGDIVSVIDMPPPTESTWWRGKKGFQVGFFPCECVEIIGDKVPQSFKFPKTSTKPVLRKHGKLIAFFRSFLLSRPSRRKLKQSGILKERVFGCDLGEHLMNSGRDIPLVLKCCTEFIEQYGIVDGIYRLSGVTSNIQKLRVAFDEDRIPNLLDEAILQDIHCVASLLKMYFRELPNPLLTFHLYDKFVSAVQADEDIRLLKLRDVVQQLPPPHYRSLEYLMRHLSKVAAHGYQTGMTPKNVAIVWAPNLLRDLESSGVGALHVVGVQAVLTEYLIRYTDIIFSEKMPVFPSPKLNEEAPKKSRPKSLAVSTPTKLLSLEEARSRALTATLPGDRQKFIDVGGGEENLPIKYHTVIDLPARRYSVGKSKKSPSGWKSFFSRGWQTTSGRRKNRRTRNERPKIGSPIFLQNSPIALQDKAVTEYDVCHINHKKLRTVKSVETLFPLTDDAPQRDASTFTPIEELPSPSVSFMNESSTEVISSGYSPAKLSSKHVRSNSHDSYFERSLLDYPVDEESEFGEISEQTGVSQMAHENRMKEDAFSDDSKDSPSKRSAQKQKCLNFDSEASSPKLQKLSLKRVYHNVNSPPSENKAVIKREKNSETVKDSSAYVGKSRSTTSIPVNCSSSNHGSNSASREANRQLDNGAGDVQCISAMDDSDNLMDFSMEATLSESVNISQLMSFDSLDQLMSANNAENTGDELNSNMFPHDSCLATPDSPTGDNVSDIPSSGDSDIIESNPELLDSKNDSDFISEVESRRINRAKTDSESLTTSAEKHVPCSQVNEMNGSSGQVIEPKTSDSKSNNSSPDVHKILSLDGSFVGDIILSPPENFVDKSPLGNFQVEKSFCSGNISNPKNSNVSCGRSMGRSKTEIHEICSKFVSGIAVSGSFGPELFKTTSDFVDAQIFHKKRSCSDKLSPISPNEDSRRRFESEIGRLIVRDRQMKLEMEQRKSEKQNLNTYTVTPEKNKVKNKTEKKFADVLDFRKSPLKTDESDMRNKLETDEIFKNFKENIDDRKLSDVSPGYSRYVRMENKPSVKELMSKFEGTTNRTEESLTKSFMDGPTTSPIKSSVFSNIQVINHNFSLTPTKNTTSNLFDSHQSSKDNHESFLKEHIFQTECVIRFPHPKSSVLSEIQPDSCKNIVKTSVRDPGVSHINVSFPDKSTANDIRTIKSADNINSILDTTLASDSMQLDKICTEKERYLDNGMSKCVSSDIQPTVFSGFTDTFQRATRATARMRDEFLRKGLPILTPDNGNGTSLLAQDSYRSADSNHYSLSPPSSRKRQTRQRPKSVPPHISRLSLPHTNLTSSPQQQNVAKDVSLSSAKEPVVDASQMPNRVRDRAALFERSLSFSGHDDKRTISCCHSQKSIL